MISLLIWVLILLLIFGVFFWVIDLIPYGEPSFKMIAKAILAIVLLLILIDALVGGRLGLPNWRVQ